MHKDDLGDRMKKYEYITRTHLMPRTPVIIRVDGKAFHSFTKGFKRPFDELLVQTMQETMKDMCKNIQGCVLGYTQSDEITLVLVDYQTLTTNAWFDYNIQKCASIAASMVTMYFNKNFKKITDEYFCALLKENEFVFLDPENEKYYNTINKALQKGAMFDARVFNIPKEEVCNCILWRQQDASRNSIQMVAQSKFSHKELQGKSCDELQELLFQKHNINWNNLPIHLKRGSCCIRQQNINNPKRNPWVIDKEIPKFINDDRNYIEDLIKFTKKQKNPFR